MGRTAYDEAFYKFQGEQSRLSAQRLLPLAFSLIECKSLLDVGCGVGPWVATAKELGVPEAIGVDGSYVEERLLVIPKDMFVSADLTQALDMQRRFDLVISLEVAEHIPPSSAETFVDNLTKHSDAIVFSEAIPGQGGNHHVNEQWPEYWESKFKARGYLQFDVFRKQIWNDSEIPWWYRQNVYLYVKAASLSQFRNLAEIDLKSCAPVASVHPELFTERINEPMPLRRILRDLPAAIRTALAARARRVLSFGS